ncbi:hypothetical protein PFISCL1PPCAC_26474, partial [Pristionchus fissidentatus]
PELASARVHGKLKYRAHLTPQQKLAENTHNRKDKWKVAVNDDVNPKMKKFPRRRKRSPPKATVYPLHPLAFRPRISCASPPHPLYPSKTEENTPAAKISNDGPEAK